MYYAVSSDKWTNVKIRFMSRRTHYPLLPPECPPPCSGPGTGRREVLGSVPDNQQFNTFTKEKATFHLGQSLLSIWSQSQGQPWPKGPGATSLYVSPTQGTRISFHYKPHGRRCQLKSSKVKKQFQSTLRKTLSSLKDQEKKEVSTQHSNITFRLFTF